MEIGFAQLLAYVAHSLLLALLAFLAARTRDWILGSLLLALAVSAPLCALYAVLQYDGRFTLPPGPLWCFFQLFVFGTGGGIAFTWGGWRSAFVLLYGVCVVVVSGCFVTTVAANDGLSSHGVAICVAFLYGCLVFLSLYLHTCLIPSLARDDADRANDPSSIPGRVRKLRKTLWIVVATNALWGVLAAAPWCLVVVYYDTGHFMAHPAGGPGLGALLLLLSLLTLPGAIAFGTATSYFVSRWR